MPGTALVRIPYLDFRDSRVDHEPTYTVYSSKSLEFTIENNVVKPTFKLVTTWKLSQSTAIKKTSIASSGILF